MANPNPRLLCFGGRVLSACCLVFFCQTAVWADSAQPAMHVLKTSAGTRFGLFGEKPDSPAPTLFVFAGGVDDMAVNRLYSESGRQLAKRGWLYVTVDIPCHGRDHRDGEPGGLSGWAHRIKKKEDLMGPFVEQCRDVLNYLIAEKYTDAKQVGACGTSRGGFCAFHFAAKEPRVRAVTGISPVTHLLRLREFSGIKEEQVESINVVHLVEKLADRAIWISIGNRDLRVGTGDSVAVTRKLVAEAHRLRPEQSVIPIELIVGPTNGHRAIEGAYLLAADFLRAQIEGNNPQEKKSK